MRKSKIFGRAINVDIRPVNINDSQMVLNWRNDSSVRKWSQKTELIDVDAHQKWFMDWILDYSRKGFFYIIQTKKASVGMLRLDFESKNTLEISIIVDPRYQGQGVARSAIRIALAEVQKKLSETTIRATVHCDNLGSIRLFSKLGFKHVEHVDNFLILRRDVSTQEIQ
jgi:RimJ/RimL family protein N-acetyltransferase